MLNLRTAVELSQREFMHNLMIYAPETRDIAEATYGRRVSQWERGVRELPDWAADALVTWWLTLWKSDLAKSPSGERNTVNLYWLRFAGLKLLEGWYDLWPHLDEAATTHALVQVNETIAAYNSLLKVSLPTAVADGFEFWSELGGPHQQDKLAVDTDRQRETAQARTALQDLLSDLD